MRDEIMLLKFIPSAVLKKWVLAGLTVLQSGLYAQSIFDAARLNDTLIIKHLHALHRDTINSKNENGFSPLIIAVYRQQADAARLLLQLGADPNVNSPEGTALVAASYKGDLTLLNLLLSKGAKLDESNEDGVSALMYAAQLNHKGIVIRLIEQGANKTLRSKAGYTALDYAKKNDHNELLQLLITFSFRPPL
jgi:uncharacterized protein